MRIIRAPYGTAREEVDAADVVVPDLWHTAELLRELGFTEHSAMVLETWHLAHDLLHVVQGDSSYIVKEYWT